MVKNFLAFMGAIFLLLLAVGGVFWGYQTWQGKQLDESSKAWVESNLPPILSTWSKDELIKRSSRQLLGNLAGTPGQLDQILGKLSKLGALKQFGEVKGQSQVTYNLKEGKVVSANYVAAAKFANADATLSLRLIMDGGNWQLLYFNVNSPLLVQ